MQVNLYYSKQSKELEKNVGASVSGCRKGIGWGYTGVRPNMSVYRVGVHGGMPQHGRTQRGRTRG